MNFEYKVQEATRLWDSKYIKVVSNCLEYRRPVALSKIEAYIILMVQLEERLKIT